MNTVFDLTKVSRSNKQNTTDYIKECFNDVTTVNREGYVFIVVRGEFLMVLDKDTSWSIHSVGSKEYRELIPMIENQK